MKWMILLLGIASNSAASVLIKVGMMSFGAEAGGRDISRLLTNFQLWLGLFLYGLAFVLYAVALTKLPLNVAHPVLTSGAIATVAICSSAIFHETFYWTTIVGLVFIVCGVVLISMRVSS